MRWPQNSDHRVRQDRLRLIFLPLQKLLFAHSIYRGERSGKRPVICCALPLSHPKIPLLTQPLPGLIVFSTGRKQPWDAHAVGAVLGAVVFHEVAFLKEDSNEDVSSGRDREYEVPDGHVRGGPKGDHKTQIVES
jgi:hypothetical protein